MSNLKKYKNISQNTEDSGFSQTENTTNEASGQIKTQSQTSFTDSSESHEESKCEAQQTGTPQNSNQPQNYSLILSNTSKQVAPIAKYVQNSLEGQIQVSNQEIQSFEAIPLQICEQIQQIKTYELSIESDLDSLDLLIKYCPNPEMEIDAQGNVLDNEFNDYCKKIKQLKDDLVYFRSWPAQLNYHKTHTKKRVNEFKRIQSELIDRVKQHLQITYKINKEDFIDTYKENQQFITQCNEFKETLDKEIDNLRVKKVGEIISTLKLCFNKMYGFGEDFEKSTINTLLTELSTLETQREKDIMDVSKTFAKSMKEIYDKKINIDYTNKLISDKKNYQSQEIQKKQEVEGQLKKQKQQSEQQKQQQLDSLSKQIQELTKKEQDLFSVEQDEKQAQYQKKMAQISQLHSQSNFSQSKGSAKSCFHYIYMIDESGSFDGSPHDNGIEGIIQSIQRLNQQDYASVIKFDSSSRVKFQKQQKSSININSLRSQIQHCASGGTNFTSAFELLQQHVKNHVGSNEYVVVIFITDGQDSCNVASISQSIRNQCGNFTFFSVGYGSINENQLQTITNVMNDTSGCTKNINSKNLKLFYKNNTPQQLLSDLGQITDQSCKVSIQDIQQAQKSIESLSESVNDNISSFYGSQKSNIQKQKQALEMNDNSAYENKIKNILDNISQNIKDSHNDIANLEKQTKQSETECEQIKNSFYNLYPNVQKNSDIESIRDQQQVIINDQFKQNKSDIQKKIQEEEKKRLDQLQKQLESVNKYGFQTLEKFKNLDKEINRFQNVQTSFQNVTNSLQDMVDNLIQISKLLDKNILISANNLKALNQHNNMNRFIEYFQNYDSSISETNKCEAIQKILFITDNSAFQIAQMNNEMEFYQQAVLLLDMNLILQSYDQEQKEIKKTFKQVQTYILPMPKEIKNLESKKARNQQKVDDIETKIENIKTKIEDETDDKKLESLEKQVEDLENKKESIEEDSSKIYDQISQLEEKYESQNELKIKILSSIFYTMIQAVKNSVLKYQFKASIMPFINYVAIQSASQKALTQY